MLSLPVAASMFLGLVVVCLLGVIVWMWGRAQKLVLLLAEERAHVEALATPEMIRATFSKGLREIEFKHPAVGILAMDMQRTLTEAGAKSFMTCTMQAPDGEKFEVTVRRGVGGVTPAEQLEQFKKVVESQRALIYFLDQGYVLSGCQEDYVREIREEHQGGPVTDKGET